MTPTRTARTRVAVVFGTRPEAIKLAPVIRGLRTGTCWDVVVVSTGQHRQMLDQNLHCMGVESSFDLGLMTSGQNLRSLTAAVVSGVGELLASERPDVVIVQGDTTTAMAAALAAFYERIPVAHVEAGLRSGVASDPFPEEMNRRLIAPIAQWHFAPTALAQANLIHEGVPAGSIEVTGNTGIDNLLWALSQGHGLSAFKTGDAPRVLATLHRRENQGAAMREMAHGLAQIAASGADVVLPLHLSPAVRECILPELAGSSVRVLDPLDYFDFTATLADCDLVVTDSGGIQEEAPALGKPVVVLRDTTERPEGVECGAAVLAGANALGLVREVTRLLGDRSAYEAMSGAGSPYGDGGAAVRIVRTLNQHFSEARDAAA